MKSFPYIIFLLIFTSCNLERNIEIDLPAYENELVVESYIEPGKPYLLTLSESISYFEIPGLKPIDLNQSLVLNVGGFEVQTTFQDLIDQGLLTAEDVPGLPPTYDDAVVVITHNGVSDTLENTLYLVLDPRTEAENPYFKFYNFISTTPVTLDYDNPFFLSIMDIQGRVVTGEAQFKPPVPIDSLKLRYNSTNMASLETWITDPEPTGDFYRRVVNKSTLYRRPYQVFSFDDSILEGSFVLGTGNDFEQNDTLISTIYTIDEAYYDFSETFEDAVGANGNPFAQPTRIKSTVLGGIGVFTALTFDRDTIIVP